MTMVISDRGGVKSIEITSRSLVGEIRVVGRRSIN